MSAFYCSQCEIAFSTADEYELHDAEIHEFCDHPNCLWKGPNSLLIGHKLSHVSDGINEETEAARWVNNRRIARQAARLSAEERDTLLASRSLSTLESFLRSHHNTKSSHLNQQEDSQFSLHSHGNIFLRLFESKRKESMGQRKSSRADKPVLCEYTKKKMACTLGRRCKAVHEKSLYYKKLKTYLRSGNYTRNASLNKSTITWKLIEKDVLNFERQIMGSIKYIIECPSVFKQNQQHSR